MKSKTPKNYVVSHGDLSVFKAYTKRDIQAHLNISNYWMQHYCWEESTLNINQYYDDIKIIDLTLKKQSTIIK